MQTSWLAQDIRAERHLCRVHLLRERDAQVAERGVSSDTDSDGACRGERSELTASPGS